MRKATKDLRVATVMHGGAASRGFETDNWVLLPGPGKEFEGTVSGD